MKESKTNCLRLIFTFFIFHCSLFICYAQVASRTDGDNVFYYDSLFEAVAASGGVSVDQPDEIILLADLVLDEPLIVSDGVHIRLVANGSDRTIRRSGNNIDKPVIWVRGDSASLSLGKPGMEPTRTEPLSGVASTMRGSPLHELVIDGGRLSSPPINAHATLIALTGPGSKLVMYDMVVLQNNINIGDVPQNYAYQYGAGVFINSGRDAAVSDRPAEFIMKGGTIRGNINDTLSPIPYGGAVQIQLSGIFTMEGGAIMNNAAHQGGGVYVAGVASFNKTGGIIYGSDAPAAYRNTAITGLGTPPCYGHAVAVAGISQLLLKFRSNTVGGNENLSYIANGGISGKEGKWDTHNKALLRMLFAIILPIFALAICVVIILRKRYVKKLSKEIQETADKTSHIDLENIRLSDRDKEIFELLLTDRPIKEIASILSLTYPGATHRAQKLYKELGVKNRTELLVRVKKMSNEGAAL